MKGKKMESNETLQIVELINTLRAEVLAGQKELRNDFKESIEKISHNQEACERNCKKTIDTVDGKINNIELRLKPLELKLENVEMRKNNYIKTFMKILVSVTIAAILLRFEEIGKWFNKIISFIFHK